MNDSGESSIIGEVLYAQYSEAPRLDAEECAMSDQEILAALFTLARRTYH